MFIEDIRERSSVNIRTLYSTVYSDGRWSIPQPVDNDDTLDDYPGISDLGDGRILITWSSADRVLNDGATVEEAAKAMNIKARFLNKSTAQFDGEAMQVTKTTEEDYSADTMANAAYDADTGRLILYYTKTEYDGLEDVGDLTSDKKVFSA